MEGIYPHTVTFEPISGRDAYGAASYGTAVTAAALVIPGNRVVTTSQGRETVTRARIVCQGNVSVAADSVVTVPSTLGFDSRLRVIDARVYADPETGETGNVEVYV